MWRSRTATLPPRPTRRTRRPSSGRRGSTLARARARASSSPASSRRSLVRSARSRDRRELHAVILVTGHLLRLPALGRDAPQVVRSVTLRREVDHAVGAPHWVHVVDVAAEL